MAIVDDNMMEELACAETFQKKDTGDSCYDWNSMKDNLMEILSSEPGLAESGKESAAIENILSRENVASLGFNGRSDEDEDLIDDDMGNQYDSAWGRSLLSNALRCNYIEEISKMEHLGSGLDSSFTIDDAEDLVLRSKNGRAGGGSLLSNAFRPNYMEKISKMEHLGYGLDLNFAIDDVEPPSEEIFKVWDLGISDELADFSELSKPFAGIPPQIQSTADRSTSMDVSIGNVISGFGHLSLIKHTK